MTTIRTVASLLMIPLALVALAVGTPSRAAGQSDILSRKSVREIELPKEPTGEAAGETEKTGLEGPRLEELLLERAVDPDVYVLAPGDELILNIMSAEPKTFLLSVLPEGDVLIPGVGAVHADGLTLNQFRAELSAELNRYFKNIELFCYLTVPARFRVLVTGEVNRPGAVDASGVERVTDAIDGAGGVTGTGSKRLITLERGADTMRVDLLRFYALGDLEANPFLRSGDRVHVPPRGWRVSIFGQVKKPGFYDVIPGETVRDLVDFAGGFTSEAMTDSVLLTRVGAEGRATTSAIAPPEFDMSLRDRDEIAVFDALKGRRVVYVRGAAFRTGRFVLGAHEGIAELIVRAGGFTDKADLSSAYIDRADGRVIRVDLQDVLSPTPAENIPLDDGDALTVPALATTVTVGGEVNKPGEFDYSGDLTVAQYIGLAGGPTRGGSVDRVALYAPDGTCRSAHRDTHPGRGDVIIVRRSMWSIGGEFFGGLIRLGTVVVSIIVLTK